MKTGLFFLSFGVVLTSTSFLPASASLASAEVVKPIDVILAQGNYLTGNVTWFDQGKGFGYIAPDDGSKNVIVRSDAITGESKVLQAGQKVKFQIQDTPSGPKAVNVSPQ